MKNTAMLQRFAVVGVWVSRIVAALLAGLLLFFVLGEGVPPLEIMTVCLALWLSGAVLVWRFPGLGGSVMLGGIGSFYLLNLVKAGGLPGGPVFPVMWLPPVLALAARGISIMLKAKLMDGGTGDGCIANG